MDEALDFRGNLYFGAVAACCVGCACWQRSFNLLQRWTLILICMSLVGTYTPWAFGQSLANLQSYGGEQGLPFPGPSSRIHMDLQPLIFGVLIWEHAGELSATE